jgi:hypothetical protein
MIIRPLATPRRPGGIPEDPRRSGRPIAPGADDLRQLLLDINSIGEYIPPRLKITMDGNLSLDPDHQQRPLPLSANRLTLG